MAVGLKKIGLVLFLLLPADLAVKKQMTEVWISISSKQSSHMKHKYFSVVIRAH